MKTLLLFLLSCGSLFAQLNISNPFYVAPILKASAAAAGYTASSIDYSGTNQNVTFSASAVTMSGAGKVFTISVWVNPDTDGTTLFFTQGRTGTSGPQWRLARQTDNSIQLLMQDSTPATILNMATAANVAEAADGWVHFFCSLDLANTGNRSVYINGSSAAVTWTTYTDAVLALDRTHLYIGTDDSNGGDVDGQVAELWVDDAYWVGATYISSFISGGNPVNLGSDGSTPTGSAPDLYMRFISGSLGVNSGADGGTGTLNGPPTSGPTFP